MDIKEVIEIIIKEGLYKGTLSQPTSKSNEYIKTVIHRIEEDKIYYQFESFTKEQAFHKNVTEEALGEELFERFSQYKQLNIKTAKGEKTIRISNKGKMHIAERGLIQPITGKKHNEGKNHLLPEGEPVDFLIHLGIMDEEGRVKHKWFDKFRQINRYLEIINDSLKYIDTEKPTIIDFGCGKSYLTFALYYYLVKVKKMNVKIIGLDLKEKVIEELQELTRKLDYSGLLFYVGDIAMFDYSEPIDMVISLHACNLATDYALEKAVKWNAKVIMAVPCCHKEINQQINIAPMEPVLGYGILKERISALMTDGLRGELLKAKGYEVSLLEFVDMEHTPKNIMIRGYKTGEALDKPSDMYYDLCRTYKIEPMLEKLLF